MKSCYRTWGFAGLLSIVLSFPAAVTAQITITSNDVLGLVGKSQVIEFDTTNSIAVNVGSAGANRQWDFRSVVLQADEYTYRFLTPATTPFAANFPQSNFVLKGTVKSEPDYESYSYLQVSSTTLRTLGTAAQTPDTAVVTPADPSDFSPLPLQFGASWNTVDADTIGDPQTFAFITKNVANNTVDAWGVVRVPAGDFDCLRIRNNEQFISQTVLAGTVFASDTTTSIEYSWVSKNQYLIAQASSQDGETNPNFTDASSFGRITSSTTGVVSRDQNPLPENFALAQNFPNPFNPDTRITFEMREAGRAELAVYTLAGERVRTLLSTPLAAGTHSAVWDGKDQAGNRLASGFYLYRLQVGNTQQTKRMLLVK